MALPLAAKELLMNSPKALADPISDCIVEPMLAEPSAVHAPYAAAGPPHVCAELDRYDIAVVLQAIYEWGGYRYTNATDAIAAAKRGASAPSRTR
jgi:hypothetical protein